MGLVQTPVTGRRDLGKVSGTEDGMMIGPEVALLMMNGKRYAVAGATHHIFM